MPEAFHFIQPWWLLALVPLLLLAWRVYRPGDGANPWRRIVDARLLPLMMSGRSPTATRARFSLLALGWTLAVLALANPTWERNAQPVYQTSTARVVVLDLSSSMDAGDLKPSRLVRARYKIEDVLRQGTEGQTALVVYAGDAFTVSPLTRDANTIRALLPALDPSIMPTDGRRADLGLRKAGELLRRAGAANGQVLLIADGIDPSNAATAAAERAAARLRADGYLVSILGVGTDDRAPLINARGELLRDDAGKLVPAGLDAATLQSLARAGGGEYRRITDNGDELGALLRERPSLRADAVAQTGATAEAWKNEGPLLAALLLPLAALAFRRNWLLAALLLVGVASPPRAALASTWDDLWQRPDQQAAKALDAGDYALASKLAPDPARRGSAEYKLGDYQRALDGFTHAAGADADYNRGNALAKLGRYQEAVAAYQKALDENPGNDDARANKAAVEALLKQRRQEPPSPPQGKSQNGSKASAPDSASNGAQGSTPGQDRSGQSRAPSGQVPQDGENVQKPGAGSQDNAAGNDGRRDQGKSGEPAQSATPNGGRDKQPATADAARASSNNPGGSFAEAANKLVADRSNAANAAASPRPDQAPAMAGRAGAPASANGAQHAPGAVAASAQPLDSEERMAAEQWLRRIPDDPGGLLRRKFLYQYRQRAQEAHDD